MAIQAKDFFRTYTKRGDLNAIFEIVREDTTSAVVQYFAYQNEDGSYVIQRSTTSGSLTVLAYQYYGVGKKPSQFADDWSNRANLTYGEYYALFNQAD